MITWGQLVPQIAVGLAIIAAAVVIVRQVAGLAKSLVKPSANGGPPESRLAAIESTIESHGRTLEEQGKMLRKQFRATATVQRTQNEILEHLTGSHSSEPPIPDDIDAADTGEWTVSNDTGRYETR